MCLEEGVGGKGLICRGRDGEKLAFGLRKPPVINITGLDASHGKCRRKFFLGTGGAMWGYHTCTSPEGTPYSVGISRVVFLGNHWTRTEQAAGDLRGDPLSSQSLFYLSLHVSSWAFLESLSQGFAGHVFMKLFLSWTCCISRPLLSYRPCSRVVNCHNFTLSSKLTQTQHWPLKGGVRLCV